jgi:glycerol-3-phosphate acyltransferase PlsY
MPWLYFTLLVLGAYLVGAIPNGLIIGRLLGKSPLEVGSGKTGATNTLRAAGPFAAAAVLLLDLLKGALVVIAARVVPWPNDAWLGLAMGCSAAAAIVGHNWSLWVRLYSGKWGGGRGIVVALGAMLLVNPWLIVAGGVVGAVALLLTRQPTIGAVAGAIGGLVAIVALAATGQMSPWLVPGTVAWCLLIILGFHDNIGRLLKGTEIRLGG